MSSLTPPSLIGQILASPVVQFLGSTSGCIRESVSIRITDEQDEAVYESRVYPGDRVVFTQNSRDYGVKNGSRGTVLEINCFTTEITVVLDNKKYVRVRANKFPHIRLGYAVTTFKSQSASIPRIYVIAAGSLNLPSSYTQGSRAIEQTQWYTTKDLLNPYLENVATSPLAKRMSRKPDLRLATELLQDAPLDLRPPKLHIPKEAEKRPRKEETTVENIEMPPAAAPAEVVETMQQANVAQVPPPQDQAVPPCPPSPVPVAEPVPPAMPIALSCPEAEGTTLHPSPQPATPAREPQPQPQPPKPNPVVPMPEPPLPATSIASLPCIPQTGSAEFPDFDATPPASPTCQPSSSETPAQPRKRPRPPRQAPRPDNQAARSRPVSRPSERPPGIAARNLTEPVAKIDRPTPQSLPKTFSNADGYQRLRLPAVSHQIANGMYLFASCADGGSPEHSHRPPPSQGHAIPYAADSIRVRRLAPVPSETIPLAAATRRGMLSLVGTGSQERVRVVCPPGECWEITVDDALGFISAQDDIAGAVRLYQRDDIVSVLHDLDGMEKVLRSILPQQCLLLSLFSCVRREISWLLPAAFSPDTVANEFLERFWHMLFMDRTAFDLFSWFREELKSTEVAALLHGMQPHIKGIPYLPSESTLLQVCSDIVHGRAWDTAFDECIDSMSTKYRRMRSTDEFNGSIDDLENIFRTVEEVVAKWHFSPEQKRHIVAVLMPGTALTSRPYTHFPDVLAHSAQIDCQAFNEFPPLYIIWHYVTNYVHGRIAEMNEKYQAFLADVHRSP